MAAFNRFLEVTHLVFVSRAFSALFNCVRPSYLASGWATLRQMNFSDQVVAFLGLQIGILICLGRCVSFTGRFIWQIILAMASDQNLDRKTRPLIVTDPYGRPVSISPPTQVSMSCLGAFFYTLQKGNVRR